MFVLFNYDPISDKLSVLADDASAKVMPSVTAGRCGADLTVCKPESYETTTIYEVDPIYVTTTETETSVKVSFGPLTYYREDMSLLKGLPEL